MRKLLLVMLVPILVLGIMGCNKIDPDVQTDYIVQGAWVAEDEGYTLIINAGTLVVKYKEDVSTPYRTEWSRDGEFDAEKVTGSLTLFDYKTNTEIATIDIDCTAGETLTVDYPTGYMANEEYYYSNAFPKDTTYKFAGATGKNGTVTADPEKATEASFKWDAAAGKIVYTGTGVAPIFTVSYEGRDGTTYGPSATPPTDVGKYKATVTIDDPKFSGGPFTYEFQILTDILVRFGDGAGQTEVTASGTSVPVEYGTNNFTVTYGVNNYERVISRFSVTLPDGVKLGDYASVKFTALPVAGDATYKPVFVFVSTTETNVTGYRTKSQLYPYAIDTLPKAPVGSSPADDGYWYEVGHEQVIRGLTDPAANVSINISNTAAKALTGEIWFGIYVPCVEKDNGDVPTKLTFGNMTIAVP
jgi:hypothetical protein